MKYSSFKELKADTQPAQNMEEAMQRHKEFEEAIIFLRSKIVKKTSSENKTKLKADAK